MFSDEGIVKPMFTFEEAMFPGICNLVQKISITILVLVSLLRFIFFVNH